MTDMRLTERLPVPAAAAQQLAAHRVAAERLLAELRAGSALQHGRKPWQHMRRCQGAVLPAVARRMTSLIDEARSEASQQPMTPASQWLLAPSPL